MQLTETFPEQHNIIHFPNFPAMFLSKYSSFPTCQTGSISKCRRSCSISSLYICIGLQRWESRMAAKSLQVKKSKDKSLRVFSWIRESERRGNNKSIYLCRWESFYVVVFAALLFSLTLRLTHLKPFIQLTVKYIHMLRFSFSWMCFQI